jgi:NAD(P)-dependent dehydrogenase (short-subunit alcohol dehydrogenase family)
MLLHGKAAIVTGAASRRGIGLATARLFAAHGGRVAILDLDAEAASSAARELGASHRGFACDVRRRSDCEEAFERVLGEFGAVDILVNNAGIAQNLKIMEIDQSNYDRVLDVSLRGTLNMSQSAIPHMRTRRSGSIVCIASIAAQRGGGFFGGPHYAAAKGGVIALAKAMARELGQDRIRVNAVAPALVLTDIFEGKLTEETKAEVVRTIPLGRLGEPADVANACLFLASELSSYITGATIDVNGGVLMR